jgi:ribose/xylose/arabinose/galactoside ABC-type transport system permease subunit
MSDVSEGKLAGVIITALVAGFAIGLFTGYLIWVLKLFGCILIC